MSNKNIEILNPYLKHIGLDKRMFGNNCYQTKTVQSSDGGVKFIIKNIEVGPRNKDGSLKPSIKDPKTGLGPHLTEMFLQYRDMKQFLEDWEIITHKVVLDKNGEPVTTQINNPV